jgi:hypothetical protein
VPADHEPLEQVDPVQAGESVGEPPAVGVAVDQPAVGSDAGHHQPIRALVVGGGCRLAEQFDHAAHCVVVVLGYVADHDDGAAAVVRVEQEADELGHHG